MGTIRCKVANLKLDTRPGSVQECETDDNQHVTSVREKKNSPRFWGDHRSVTYRRLRLFLCHFEMSTCINGGVSFSYHHYCSCVSRPPSLWPVNFIPGLTNKTIVGEITPKSYPYLFNCLAFMSFHSSKILYRTASIQEEEPWG